MFTVLGILLLVAGAILTFAVERQAEGIDLQAVGWILMAGGGLSLLAATIRAAAIAADRTTHVHTERHVDGEGRLVVEDQRVA